MGGTMARSRCCWRTARASPGFTCHERAGEGLGRGRTQRSPASSSPTWPAAVQGAANRRRRPSADPGIPEAVQGLHPAGRLIIGGKSMGGRVASMIADDLHAAGRIAGLLCLGYPFHPPGKPGQLRTGHLVDLATPALICQGTRYLFGTRNDVVAYSLSPQIEMLWIEDGDHDLRPRKAVAGVSFEQSITEMAAKVRAWVDRFSG